MSTVNDELTIWTFRDASGAMHLAIALLELRLGGVSYQLAIPEDGAPIVLGPDPEHAGQLAVVVDESIVQTVKDALLAAMAGRTAPALCFVADNPEGQRSQYQATQMVAHSGANYLVALDAAGLRQVFALDNAKDSAEGTTAGTRSPRLIRDPVLTAQILKIAPAEQDLAEAIAAPLPKRVTLQLADGERRELQIVESLTLDGERFVIGIDSGSEQRAYTLKVGAHGHLDPVSDPALVERLRKVLSAA